MADVWVQRGADDYARAIEGELPTGAAWSRDLDGGLMRWVAGCAQIWGDVDAAAALLVVTESDPRQCLELLPDWERAFGLPDPCNAEVQTVETRRAALLNKLTTIGGQSRAFFISVAASIGYQITIYEYLPVSCGISVCGETRPDGDASYVPARCGVAASGLDHMCDIEQSGGDNWMWRLGPPELRFYWRVAILNTRLTWLRMGVGVSGRDHMCEFGIATDLECLIRRWAPAHTLVLFDYSQVTDG